MQDCLGNLLTEAQTTTKMLAYVSLHLQLLMISYISSKGKPSHPSLEFAIAVYIPFTLLPMPIYND